MTAPANPPWDLNGPEDAPLLVFVHGTRLTRASWHAVVDQLATGYRCLCLDLPGHGVNADRPFDLDVAAESVIEAIDAAGAGRAVVVGLSLGGYVAMTAAAAHPDRVRGLVIAGATAEPAGPAAAAFRLFAWALHTAPTRAFDAVNTWFFRHRYPPAVAEPIVAGGYWSRGGAMAVRSLLRGARPATFRERLLAYGGPILVINGDLDIVFQVGARHFLRGIPNVTRRTLRRSTHLSPLDRPEAFAAAVRRFVEGLPA